MFSTSALCLRLLQTLPIRQPVLLSAAWSQVRHYNFPRSPPTVFPQQPSGSLQDPRTWNVLGGYAQSKSTPIPVHTIDETWKNNSSSSRQDLLQYPPANPYSGRSVRVVEGNIADAYQKLHLILQRNKVRPQLRLAERHEKKGDKRRRLSSERWRKQFAHEVRKKVQLVTKIRNRGA